MFRSVDMSYLQILMPPAVAEEFADRMAREDIMQFTDLNEDLQPFQRKYTSDIIKIQDIERQIKVMEELLESYSIEHDTEVIGEDLINAQRLSDASQLVEAMKADIGDAYKKLKEQANVEQELKKQLTEQESLIYVLNQLDDFLEGRTEMIAEQLGSGDGQRDVGFKYFAGVVTIGQRVSFERQVFLTSRGNSFIQFDDEDDSKIPFVVFFLGDQLKRSLRRLCQFMNIQICYESDDDRSREELLTEAQGKKNDFYRIHSATANQLERDMAEVGGQIKKWKVALLQEKAIRITLNQFSNQSANTLRAEGWCPSSSQRVIEDILDAVAQGKGVGKPVVHDANPRASSIVPTHFETNEFTAKFQEIVDTYGTPRYKEYNPAVPTIITFPFLFAVMYGDVFHGSFILLAGIVLCFGADHLGWTESRNGNLKSFAEARYVLLFMGLFAVYCGVIYNDVMSIMINGFNTSQWGYGFVGSDTTADVVLFQRDEVYAFGIDPVWYALDNQLTYENSLKMKLSVIIGVTQMTYGLFLKFSNHINEGDFISVFFEFIPQLIFMLSFFGYMCFLIVYKWCIDWGTTSLPATPSLITVLIKMILSIGTINDETQVFDSADAQMLIQEILVICMGVSIPWMLVFKPLLLKSKHNREVAARQQHRAVDLEAPSDSNGYGKLLEDHGDDEDEEKYQAESAAKGGHGGGHGHGEEFEFSEVVIHQLIHTIEYVLGTISNTASYLRLWALSLAHAELSEVFYDQTIGGTMNGSPSAMQIVLNVAAQFVFLMATVGVLLVMDVLECFLHALRLHWVEFQNKFFYADGVSFKPFSYRHIFDDD